MGIPRLQPLELGEVSRIDAGIAEYDAAIGVDIGERVEDMGEIAGGQVGYARALAVYTP